MITLTLYGAAFILGMILIANFIAPKMLGYKENSQRMDTFIGQVFNVHCFYTSFTMLGMALACILYTDEITAGTPMGRGFCIFMAFFWGSRVIIQFTYYDKAIKRKYPIFHILFSAAFIYLGAAFTTLSLLT